MSFDVVVRADGQPHVAIVAALASECASLRRDDGARWSVLQSGPGSARATAAAATALAAGARALVSWGLAGGLDASLAAGAIVVPRRVVTPEGRTFAVDPGLRRRIEAVAAELALHDGDLLTVPAVLETPAAKRAAAAASGAVAVDMESAAIASVAAAAGAPFAALRVVVDAVDDALPTGAAQWIDERGDRRWVPALCAAVDPRAWRGLVKLAPRFRAANAALDALARALADRGVFDAALPVTHDAGG